MHEFFTNSFRSIGSLEHQYYNDLWESVKSDKLETLDGRMKITGRLMLEHPEYQYFWEIPYPFAETEIEKALEEEGVNPDLHLAVEAMIAEQLENRNPPEISGAYEALIATGVDQHEARHVIGRVFMTMMSEGLKRAERGQEPDDDFYLSRIRYLAKHPKKVIREQNRIWQEGL